MKDIFEKSKGALIIISILTLVVSLCIGIGIMFHLGFLASKPISSMSLSHRINTLYMMSMFVTVCIAVMNAVIVYFFILQDLKKWRMERKL